MDMNEAAATGAFIYLIGKGDKITMGDICEFAGMYEPELLDEPLVKFATAMDRLCRKYLVLAIVLSGANPILGAYSE